MRAAAAAVESPEEQAERLSIGKWCFECDLPCSDLREVAGLYVFAHKGCAVDASEVAKVEELWRAT